MSPYGARAVKQDVQEDPVDPNSVRCGVTLHRMKDGYAGRANTVGAYFELNRQVPIRSSPASGGIITNRIFLL
jgi:hypothetical protein